MSLLFRYHGFPHASKVRSRVLLTSPRTLSHQFAQPDTSGDAEMWPRLVIDVWNVTSACDPELASMAQIIGESGSAV